jgi:hypothetical protein
MMWCWEAAVLNKIVKEHYPASKLPAELREGLDPHEWVTVEVTVEEAGPETALEEIFALRQPPFRSGQEIDDELRRQRDEWDE